MMRWRDWGSMWQFEPGPCWSYMSIVMKKSTVVFIAFTVIVAGSGWAHHNMSATFDFNQRFTETGTLTKLDSPHFVVGRYEERKRPRQNLVVRGTIADRLSTPCHRQERFRKLSREDRYGGSQSRSGRLSFRADPGDHAGGRESSVAVSTELLNSESGVRRSLKPVGSGLPAPTSKGHP